MAIQNIIKGVIISIIGLIIVYQIVGSTATDVGNSAANMTETLNGSGVCVSGGQCGGSVYPLMSLFSKGGVVLLLFMVGLLLYFVNSFIKR